MTKKYSKATGGFYEDDIHAEDQIPGDAVEITDDLHAALLDAQSKGKVITMGAEGQPIAIDRPPVLLSPARAAARLSAAVKTHVDTTAQALGYDNMLAAISYADEPSVPRFQAEGAALRAWRSVVWAAAMPQLEAVVAGGNAPTAAALIESLPSFTAPTIA